MVMQDRIKLFCSYLANSVDGSFTRNHLIQQFGDMFFLLEKQGFLQKVTAPKEIECTLCDENHFVKVIQLDDNYYVNCYNMGAMKKVEKQAILSHKINTFAFLKWLSKQLKFDEEIKRVDDKTLHFGQYSSRDYFFVNTDDYDECLKLASKINIKNKIIIWCGENPLTGFTTETLIPLSQVLKHSENDIGLDIKTLEEFLSITTHKKDDIVLDSDIVLQKRERKCCVLTERQGYGFKHEDKIREQTYRIVRFLYDIRMRSTGQTSQEICQKLSYDSSKSIPTRIRELNNICNKHNVPEAIVQNPNNTWMLNPTLDCFK